MSCSKYKEAIMEQMRLFAEDSKVIFLGQQVASEDFYGTLSGISLDKRIEMPVAEDMQMGMSIGLSLQGFLPISIYQRMDFLPRAMDQIVNHLNLLEEASRGMYKPKVIIRTTIGTKKPLDVGIQHSQDLSELMKVACKFPVFKCETADDINNAYDFARLSDKSVLVIEKQENYQ
jgi:pyruvate/2-oxoglutarate/acetoin dehydrogenase E1 component